MQLIQRLSFVIPFGAATIAAVGADWPNFRGPNHDGISDEKGFQTKWDGPIPVLWERKVGSGFSSFACVGNRVFTGGTTDKKQAVFCLNADNGEIIWQTPLEQEYVERMGGDGPRATPTVDEGRVFILGAKGMLLALDAETGKEIWRKQFSNDPQWGYSGSVLIDQNLAIVSAGKGDGALLALDKKTGERVWSVGKEPVGYATPYPLVHEGKRLVAGFMGDSAILVEAASGREVVRIPWKTDWDVNAAAPIYHEGHLFLGSGYSTGSGLFRLRSDAGVIQAESVWQSKVLMPKFQSCVLYKGNLYASDQKALVCAEFMTGKERWRKHRIKDGTVLLADGQIILLTEDGRLQIGPASPDDFVPTTDVEVLTGRCWAVPVLHHGRLFLRNLDRVVCLNLKKPG